MKRQQLRRIKSKKSFKRLRKANKRKINKKLSKRMWSQLALKKKRARMKRMMQMIIWTGLRMTVDFELLLISP